MFSDEEILESYLEDIVDVQRDYRESISKSLGDGFHLVNADIEDQLVTLAQIKRSFECKNSDDAD